MPKPPFHREHQDFFVSCRTFAKLTSQSSSMKKFRESKTCRATTIEWKVFAINLLTFPGSQQENESVSGDSGSRPSLLLKSSFALVDS